MIGLRIAPPLPVTLVLGREAARLDRQRLVGQQADADAGNAADQIAFRDRLRASRSGARSAATPRRRCCGLDLGIDARGKAGVGDDIVARRAIPAERTCAASI